MFGGDFLPKEAKLRALGRTGTQGTVRTLDALKERARPFSNTPGADPFYSKEKLVDGAREQVRSDGNGLVGDLLIGATRFLPKGKKIRDGIVNKTVDLKQGFERLDHRAAQSVKDKMGVKDGSWFDRLTSTAKRQEVGQEQLSDGTLVGLNRNWRQSSLLAPVQNTAKVTAPFLGTMYVADKMYPGEEKTSSSDSETQEKNGLENDLLVERLDKKAALDKVAKLEHDLEKMASEFEGLEEEKNLIWKQAEEERKEKNRYKKERLEIEKELQEKTASYDEYKMRSTIRERTQSAVKLAEKMLECGMIKQAEFDGKVDFLVDCDDDTFNLHDSLSKQADTGELGLETLAYIVDNSSKVQDSPQNPRRSLNKKGQTIGEAARELKN